MGCMRGAAAPSGPRVATGMAGSQMCCASGYAWASHALNEAKVKPTQGAGTAAYVGVPMIPNAGSGQ
jgi:hypothetical protein